MPKCISCNNEVNHIYNYCNTCGTEVKHSIPISKSSVKETPIKTNKKVPKYLYWLVGIIGIIVVINLLHTRNENTPKKVVEHFLKAIESGDAETAGQYIHPDIPWNSAAGKNIGVPKNASIAIQNITEDTNGDYARLRVSMIISPKPLYGSDHTTITINLRKQNGKWLIYDMQ
ncbi:zinc ribbon domain-containing protein [Paenibacillus sp. 102]|uniref:zinc ribbon domain-containing protein n=1 Tax=Paenibacillus sp. 102 TaxID=3120823 RepID=UPI0031BB97B9